jgi:RNA-directed DNA polymerase
MKKYDDLMRWVVSGAGYVKAIQAVISNKGSSGVDGMSTKELMNYLVHHWSETKESLLSGQYNPQLVRGVKIPKKSGGERLLGIPTVIDRLIQQSIHQVLNPIWEREFSQYSYGFRPKRSASDALGKANEHINAGYQWIIDLDLKSFFDKINHDKLMNILERKISDKILLRLIRKYLQSGILVDKKVIDRKSGSPQGGPLSPLLSNILLNELDIELERRGLRFVRYADDVSIFVKSKRAAQRVLESITNFLEKKLLLEVNQEKTKICRPINFNLLGHSFTSFYTKGSKGKYRLSIAKKSWEELKYKIKEITRKTTSTTFSERIIKLNQLMRGWLNYFKFATGFGKLKDLDSWLRARLRYCIWKGWKNPYRRRRAFIQLGVPQTLAKQFSYSRLSGWRIAQSPIMKTTVTNERLTAKGYISFSEYFFKLKSELKSKK